METKLFVGFRLTPEIKAALGTGSLLQIPYQGKEYVGRYLEQTSATLADVEVLAEAIKSELPMLHRARLVVFPQLFLG